eukprot:3656493-Rhodomonas_salina.3
MAYARRWPRACACHDRCVCACVSEKGAGASGVGGVCACDPPEGQERLVDLAGLLLPLALRPTGTTHTRAQPPASRSRIWTGWDHVHGYGASCLFLPGW